MSLSKLGNTKESLSTAISNLDCAVEQVKSFCEQNTDYTYLEKNKLYDEIRHIDTKTREEMAIRKDAAHADADALATATKMWKFAITRKEKRDEVITVFIYTLRFYYTLKFWLEITSSTKFDNKSIFKATPWAASPLFYSACVSSLLSVMK